MALSDVRPDAADLIFRPGTTVTRTLEWPTGSLAGRSFTSTLAGQALALSVVDDTMTVVADDTITGPISTPVEWLLLEDIGGTPEPVLIGTWTPSDSPRAVEGDTLTVTVGADTIQVTTASAQASVVALENQLTTHEAAESVHGWTTDAGLITWPGDLTISGELKTGTPEAMAGGTGIVFGGLQREGRVIGAGGLCSPTGTITFDNDVPRISMPSGVTTHVYATFALEEWWLESTIGMYIEWVADAATNGDVAWQFALKEIDIGSQGPATGDTPVNVPLRAESAPAAGSSMTTIIASNLAGNPWTPAPGLFASFYVARITRLGADAADTLPGPAGLVEFSYVRGL